MKKLELLIPIFAFTFAWVSLGAIEALANPLAPVACLEAGITAGLDGTHDLSALCHWAQ